MGEPPASGFQGEGGMVHGAEAMRFHTRLMEATADAVVVLGSENSSNTKALAKVAVAMGCPRVLRVNGPEELPDDLGSVTFEGVQPWVRVQVSQSPGKVVALVGVVAAHDRAVKLLPKRHQLTGQLPLLLVMVFYTVSGLYLLFGS